MNLLNVYLNLIDHKTASLVRVYKKYHSVYVLVGCGSCVCCSCGCGNGARWVWLRLLACGYGGWGVVPVLFSIMNAARI